MSGLNYEAEDLAIDNGDDNKPVKKSSTRVVEVAMEEICLNPQQPRKTFSEEGLQELADSIEQHGLLQPVVLSRKDGLYHLVVGERRLRAAKSLGMEKIPAIIHDSDWEEMLHLALVENLQREDLNPVEEARSYRVLLDEYGRTQEEVAQLVGKSRPYVANLTRLLNLPDQVLSQLESGEISAGHGRALLALDDRRTILKLVAKIIKENLSVRQTEELIRQIKEGVRRRVAKIIDLPYELRRVQDQLAEKFSSRVEIRPGKGNSGKIEIHYGNVDDLTRIVDNLGIRDEWH